MIYWTVNVSAIKAKTSDNVIAIIIILPKQLTLYLTLPYVYLTLHFHIVGKIMFMWSLNGRPSMKSPVTAMQSCRAEENLVSGDFH